MTLPNVNYQNEVLRTDALKVYNYLKVLIRHIDIWFTLLHINLNNAFTMCHNTLLEL